MIITMRATRQRRKKILIIALVGLLGIIATFLVGYFFISQDIKTSLRSTAETGEKEIPEMKELELPSSKLASDKTLGSGFEISYPKAWTYAHSGAEQPTAKSIQTDETTITSPSGKVQVALKVQTNAKTSAYCTPDYIQLKYLAIDTLKNFSDGRFAAYVVYFPSLELYQYNAGLQKNTEAIKGVSLTSNTACNFLYGEFVQRPSSIAGVPLTSTTLSIRFLDLSSGQSLPKGANEESVAAKLTGVEYDQAKAIVQSVRIAPHI